MKEEIKNLLQHMIKAMKPYLHYFYNCTYPHDKPTKNFHIVGVDIIFDENCKPWLLEINANPSMGLLKANYENRDDISQLDYYIKSQ